MEVGSVVLGDMEFRGVEFSLKLELEEEVLVVEIMDSVTADQWRREFDPAYIENLTRKTGNFKQFPIFCNMLESAVNKTSEAVALDLLTYADLELLRNRKAGVVGRPRLQPQSPALSAKRYLILIYTVEFDRIHYPLPLPYQGKPDPAALQREIRALRAELCAMRTRGGPKTLDPETRKLHAEMTPLLSVRNRSRGEVEIQRPVSRECSLGSGGGRGRSGSRERMEKNWGQVSKEQGRRVESSGICPRILRPSPSPTGLCAPRFDPTAYIQDRQRRQRETNLKNQRKVKRDMLPLLPGQQRGRSRSREMRPQLTRVGSADRRRSLSLESRRSRRSSDSSAAEFEELPSRGRKPLWNVQALPRGQYPAKKPLCSTPTRRTQAPDKESLTDAGADLSEIDARLQALQEYMRDLDTGRSTYTLEPVPH
ncbi:coiled-coil domain-containing protein 61 isoform X3 [Anguilla anguilla]|uniref:coiled-coil domain-containing protein 61 isoform X3 n=1 Tax=Anguilla anguilla TaxID=7936 RepID=UPI0015AECFA1|nr:coiled-coil domain-containing protein 61 isoform X3 [Anguilla anguilla]